MQRSGTVRRAGGIAAALFGLSALLFACSGGGGDRHAAAPVRVKVVATIAPLADFTRRVGGERVEVVTLLPPAASPHIYAPAPRDLARIRGARLFIQVGLGFEFWADDLARSGAGRDLVLVDTSEGIEPMAESGHGGGTANPHVWLDPVLASRQVRRIARALSTADPDHATEYARNAASYLETLTVLDREIRDAVKGFTRTSFVSLHPSWSYFARRYGLTEAGVVESSPGKEPTPAELMEIVRAMRRRGVKVIFAEPQLNPKAAYVLAAEAGAEVLMLDPIGSAEPGKGSGYVAMMRRNLSVMARAMGRS